MNQPASDPRAIDTRLFLIIDFGTQVDERAAE